MPKKKETEKKIKGAKPKGYKYVFASKFCEHCGDPIAKHPRCIRCHILLHERNMKYMGDGGIQHTEIGSFGRCLACTLEEKK